MKKITIDGNGAVANIAYRFTEIAPIYPITPSSTMAELVEKYAALGEKNLFGGTVIAQQMQSEAGAAGALHGAATGGALATTFTASQGLLLMIPTLYKLAGERLPAVFHVSARSIATHALNIFCDHSDVMACRQTGAIILSSSGVQNAADMAIVAHLVALKCSLPVVHFFDGFRTSHEVNKIFLADEQDLNTICDRLKIDEAISAFRARALNPERPLQRGTAQNEDVFFQHREAANSAYEQALGVIKTVMDEVSAITGRRLSIFEYIGNKTAKNIAAAMGSASETVEEYIAGKGKEYGAITVHLYRPFYAEEFLKVLPKTVKRLAVLDRTKEAGALGEPLYLDICAALKNSGVEIFGGRYGLGGKEFTPQMTAAVFKNLENPTPKAPFTVGITDDISFTSLTVEPEEETPENQLCCKFFGYGSDGTVGAVKRTAQLVGDNTERFTQAFFCYDSKKSGGYTVSHLRVSPLPIRSPYRIGLADFIACTRTDFLKRIRFSKELKKGGVLLINTPHTESERIFAELPSKELQAIEEKQAAVYAINAHSLAEAHGLKGKISTALQAAFFALHPDLEQQTNAFALLENSVKTAFAKKGEETVEKNLAILKAAKSALIKIELAPRTEHKEAAHETGNDFWTRVAKPVLNGFGDELPVSAFCADGSIPTDTAKHEKRGITFQVPRWNETACIQCNTCAFSCPHATIRPYLIKEGEKRPEGFRSAAAKQADGYRFHMQVYPLDCTGCGVCQNVCPANRKEYANAKKENREVRREALALTVDETPAYREEEEQNRRFAATLPPVNEEITQKMPLLKRSQFSPQLFEFSGACAGCGETPYIKALTSLFGERLIIANATGCSSIYGGTFPVCPYAKNAEGRGAAWANSLFEDNAEFGCGIRLAYDQRRAKMHAALNEYFDSLEQNERAVYLSWLENQKEVRAANALAEFLQSKNAESLLAYRDCFTEKSVWCVGGDGWAYDIGFSGVDHIMASGLNIKLLVLDSEVYSNTGGQQSKATPKGAAVKFAESGKKTAKKPLAKMMTHYENVYVAQCSIGADGAQFLKALKEADEHVGPALLVCYAPCISHGYDMGKSMEHARLAAQSGYFPLFRYFNGEMHEDSKSNETLLDEFYQSELRFLTKKQ